MSHGARGSTRVPLDGRRMTREVVVTDLANYVGMQLVCESFVAPRESVPFAFPGWQQPLASPVRRHLRNPFSGELMYRNNGDPYMIDTRQPDGPWPDDISCPDLEPFPRRDFTPIGQSELSVLARCLSADVDEIEGALFAPPDYGWFLWAVPERLTTQIATVRSVESTARDWLTALHSAPDVDLERLDQVDSWVAELAALVDLAQRARREAAVLFLYEGPRRQAKNAV